MDILDFLKEDHAQMRHELSQLRRVMSQPGFSKGVSDFTAHFALHENVEDRVLFPKIKEVCGEQLRRDLVSDFEREHAQAWAAPLNELMDSLSGHDQIRTARAFLSFDVFVESHFAREERLLFPALRRVMGQKVLELLEGEAERRFPRFIQAVKLEQACRSGGSIWPLEV